VIKFIFKAMFAITLFATVGVGVLVYTGANQVYKVVAEARQKISAVLHIPDSREADSTKAAPAEAPPAPSQPADPAAREVDNQSPPATPTPAAPVNADFGAGHTVVNSNGGVYDDNSVLDEADRKVRSLAKARANAEAQAQALEKMGEEAQGNAGADLALAAQAAAKAEEVAAAELRKRMADEVVRKAASEAGDALLVKQAAEAARKKAISKLRGEIDGAGSTSVPPTPIIAATPNSMGWLWLVFAGASGLALCWIGLIVLRRRPTRGATVALRVHGPAGDVEDSEFHLDSREYVKVCPQTGLTAWSSLHSSNNSEEQTINLLSIGLNDDGDPVIIGGDGWKIDRSSDASPGDRVRAGTVIAYANGVEVECLGVTSHVPNQNAFPVPAAA